MGTEDIDELIVGHVEKGIQINAPEVELLEHFLLWLLCSNISVHIYLQMQSMHAQIRNTQKTPTNRDEVQLELGLTTVAKWNNQSAMRPLLAWRRKMQSVL